MKRVLTVQDISCVGKCSLTVALPVISAMGVEVCPLPTAILSTHTAFSSFSFCDLTRNLQEICDEWKNQQIHFDAIYTGYLGSLEQINFVHKILDDFAQNDTLVFIDPCMADNGKFYSGFNKDFSDKMANLCSRANVILPNMTEACFLTNENFDDFNKNQNREKIQKLTEKLLSLGAKQVILKGIDFSKEKIGVAFCDSDSQIREPAFYFHKKFEQNFHGTGDIFASVITGAFMRRLKIADAVKLAADYVYESIKFTLSHADYNWYGVDFESAIDFLTQNLQKYSR